MITQNKKKYILIGGLACMLILFAGVAFGATIYVPLDQPTIQAGIDAANGGDEVVIADGTYAGIGNVNLTFGGKAITVRSANGPASVIIDCENIVGRRGFYFQSAVVGMVLQGITIQNGIHDYGGGIRIGSGSSPTIDNCVIINCTANDPGTGGGVGGGINVYASSPTFTGCTITGNLSTLVGAANGGGGIRIASSSDVIITNCDFDGNTANGSGGGILNQNSTLIISGCTISNNTATGSNGGAIAILDDANVTIESCEFYGNDAAEKGGALRFQQVPNTNTLDVINCLIFDNTSNFEGVAVDSWRASPKLINCTITQNTESAGGAVIYAHCMPLPTGIPANITLVNSIIYNNIAGTLAKAQDADSSVTISYSDVDDPVIAGTNNNTDLHPQFVNAGIDDFNIQSTSPCRDAANPAAPPSPALDFAGNIRNSDGLGYDMGAYEYFYYTVNFSVGTGVGSITGQTSQEVVPGSDCTAVTPVPAIGYHFSGWTGDYTGPDDPLTITSVTSNMNITANFTLNTYNVTFTTSGNGSLSDSTTQTITHGGSTAPVTATATTGYSFTNWTGDGGFVTTITNPLTIANVTSDMNITANFTTVLNTYNVTFTTSGNGSLSDSTTQTITHGGSTAPVTANPGVGYHFVNWTGGFSGTNNPLTVTNVTSNMTITANFSINQYTVTFLVVGNGSLSGSATQTIAHGSDCTAVTANADTGYRFIDWTGDGGFVTTTTNPLTVTNVSSDMTITANFTTVLSQYLVTFQVNGNGSIDDPTTQPITHGNDTTAVTATADTGYIFVNWTGTGGFTTTDVNPMIATNVTNDMDITVNFQIITFTIDVTSGANGSISPSGSVSVDYGADQTFTISPNVNFVVEDVLVDSVSVGAVTTYTFTSVTGDHTISATFASDGDSDGVSDNEEDGAPNGGDGNNDGSPDSGQDFVTSLLTYDGQDYVTIESASGTLNNVEAIDNPSPSDSPSGTDFNYGLFDFTITGLTPGDPVTLYLPAGAAPTKYYKYGPLVLGDPPEWYEFDYDGQTGAVINGNVITLHFVDGLRGDYDLDPTNGTIVDPGGPAFASASSDDGTGGGGGSGGCFIATTSSGLPDIKAVPMIPGLFLMLLLFATGRIVYGERKQ